MSNFYIKHMYKLCKENHIETEVYVASMDPCGTEIRALIQYKDVVLPV